jgi:hypothetical protein
MILLSFVVELNSNELDQEAEEDNRRNARKCLDWRNCWALSKSSVGRLLLSSKDDHKIKLTRCGVLSFENI